MIVQIAMLAAQRGLDSERINALLNSAPPRWSLHASAEQCADDLALLIRPLNAGELIVRVAAPLSENDDWQISVVAHDRPGLLAITSAVLAAHDLSITGARATSWPNGVALQSVSVGVVGPSSVDPAWPSIGQALRNALASAKPTPGPGAFSAAWVRACDDLEVTESGKRLQVVVSTEDKVGVLAAISYALASAGANVVSAEISSIEGVVHDVFVIDVPAGAEARVNALLATHRASDSPG